MIYYRKLSPIKRLLLMNKLGGGGGSVVVKTVTQAAPITIHAVSKPIISLTQEGKVTQDGTSTPSTPKDIVCNNGTLKVIDDELPTGYKRVLGFTCDNNAMWQITGFKLKGSDTVRVSFSIDAACNVWGCYQGTDATDNYDLYASVSAGSKYLRYGNGVYLSYWSPTNLGKRFDTVVTPTGTSGMPQDSTWTAKTFTAANNLLIGSTTLTGTSAKLKGNLYGNFIVDGRLKLIPCERVSDGVLGYYDTYGETFYEPYEGYDGAVSLGYDGSHYSLATVGTPEVLSVWTPILKYTSADMSQGFGFTSTTSSKAINVILPALPVGKYIVSVPDGYQANLRGNWAGGANVASWMQSQTVTISYERENYYGIAVRKTGGTADIAPADFDGVLVIEAATQTASVADLFAVGNYKDTQEIIGGTVTRRVGAYVFDGTEQLSTSTAYGSAILLTSAASLWGANKNSTPLCTHFTGLAMISSGTAAENTCFFNASGHFYFRTSMSKTDFATLCATEYAAGTPIIAMFALATATTETVAGQHLTTVEGTNTVSVTSNVDPVTLTVVYKGTDDDH